MKQNTHLGASRSSLFVSDKGFTLIELLVTISILAALSVVAYATISGHVKSVNNATRVSTIDSLALSLSDYYQTKKTLPEPNSNYIAYDQRGTYAHSLSGAYGVSGHVSNDFLPAGYVNFSATDPESNQFYGYGKTLDPKTPTFNLAAALYDDTTGAYKAYVKGTYKQQKLTSLIRSYSSSNFVSQDGRDELPYNPYERKVTARISSLSGSLTIKDSNGIVTPLSSAPSTPFSYTGELSSGDTIIVATGSMALLHISDGSELSIGSATSQTELELTSLVYNTDNNLSTKVKLFLKSGETWAEAPHLRAENDSRSDFSIQTDSAVAAVRGTIFGMNRTSTGITSISLVEGKLEVTRYTVSALTPFTPSDGFSASSTGGFVLEYDAGGSAARSYMIVSDGEAPIQLDNITNTFGSHTTTGTLSTTETDQNIFHPPFSFGYRPIADKITFVDTDNLIPRAGLLTVVYNNPGADSYELYFGTGIVDPNLVLHRPDLEHPSYTGTLSGTGPVTITGAFSYMPQSSKIWTYSLRVCLQGICSAPDVQHLAGNTFAYGPFHTWGDSENKTQTTTGQIVQQQVTCPSSQLDALFWSPSCLIGTSSGLVAYATYDDPGETQMYTSNVTSIISQNGGNLIFSGTTGGTGVIVGLSNGYVKYDIEPLDLGNSFSIEMSVKGSDLTRNGENRLLSLNNTTTSLGLHYTNNTFNLNYFNGSSYIIIDGATITGISNQNSFYKVTLIKSNNNFTLKINDSIIGTGYYSSLPDLNNLVVGARYIFLSSTYDKQWNGIIDYVKIYK